MTAPWHATVLTLFPEMFPGPLGISLAGKALSSGLWSLSSATWEIIPPIAGLALITLGPLSTAAGNAVSAASKTVSAG